MKSVLMAMMVMVLLIGASACSDGGGEKETTVVDTVTRGIIRGHYTFGHEVRALRPCGEDEDLWVIDRTDLLPELFRQLVGPLKGDPRISVIATGTTGPSQADGFGAQYPGTVFIDEVIYAALEGFECDFDVTGFVFRAFGNEPFWMVEVLPGSMRLIRPGSPELTWPGVSEEKKGDVIVLAGTGGEISGSLTIEPGPGYDNMSGSYFHHKANFDLDGEIFSGAALRGLATTGGHPSE
jgi:uncharacterized membrane protein